MNLTPGQVAAITHRGCSLLVSASAGSGKTEVLARRVVDLLADPARPCELDRLLVVTFTRAAAAELRVRVARSLREVAAQARDPALRDHLRRQELLVPAAEIGTIDGWCNRLVRAHAAELGVDPAFTVLSEQDAGVLRAQVLDEVMDWVYRSEARAAAAARDWLGRAARPDDRFLRTFIRALNRYRGNLVETDAWFARQRRACQDEPSAIQDSALRTLSLALEQDCAFLAEQLEQLLAGAGDELAGAAEPLRRGLAKWCQQLRGAPPGREAFLALLAEIAAVRLRKPRACQPAAGALLEYIRERWLKSRLQKPWEPEAAALLLDNAPATAQLVHTLLELEGEFESRLAREKRARAACEFEDVLRLTLELLGTSTESGTRVPTETACRYRRQYEHVLVDEYQDTSPLQVELLRLVTRDERAASNAFLVGDVKQSIYGFRQAEPGLFVALLDEFQRGARDGRVHYLSDNFRSHPALLDGLNRLFATLLARELGGSDFGPEERLRAARAELPNPSLDGRPRTTLHILEVAADEAPESEGDEDIPLERVEREALAAAEWIRALRHDRVEVLDKGANQPRLRPLRYRDVVVLLRTARQNAAIVARRLREAGIPCITAGRDALLECPEVRDVRNVLALLANRRQDVALAAYLRSPLVELRSADLLAIREGAPRAPFVDAVARAATRDGELGGALRSALSRLDRWADLARRQELPDLLRCIYHETGWLLFAQALPGGAHRVNLLRALEDFAIDFARQGRHGLAEFDTYLENLALADLEPSTAVAAGEDVVRIMTIHAAKGLEFPIVLLLNAGARFNFRSALEPLQCGEDLGVGLTFFDQPLRREFSSPHLPLLRRQTRRRLLEEELRLLYVATTRARERLIVLGHAKPETWAMTLRQWGGRGTLPLATRLDACSALEWLMIGAAAAGLADASAPGGSCWDVVVRTSAPVAPSAPVVPTEPDVPWTAADDEWLRLGCQRLGGTPHAGWGSQPAVLSVSAWKELAQRAVNADADAAQALDPSPVHLGLPPFALATASADPRSRGIACHAFMQHADLTRIDTPAHVRAQLEEMVSAGRLNAADVALVPVDDIAWFGCTPTGHLVAGAAERVQREAAFVCTVPLQPGAPPIIVRGVIDLLLSTADGLVLLDYKTDHVSDAAGLAQRVALYAIQMKLYAHAATRVYGAPVCSALLAFLGRREIVAVPPGPLPAVVELLADAVGASSAPAAPVGVAPAVQSPRRRNTR